MILPRAGMDKRGPVALMTALEEAGNNLPLRRMRVIAERSVLRTITEGGRPRRWKPLAASSSEHRRDVQKHDQRYDQRSAKGAKHTGSRERRYLAKRGAIIRSHKPLMDSGRLRQSVQSKNLGRTNFKVYTDVPYAVYQHHGTGIHGLHKRAYPILPRTKKALAFPVAGRFGFGAMAFSRGHMHPGIPARPFMVWQDEDIPALVDVITEHLDRRAKRR